MTTPTAPSERPVFARITADVLLEKGFDPDYVSRLELAALQVRLDADVVDIDVLDLQVRRASLTFGSEAREPQPAGFWLARFSDWSGVAVFRDELEARRYAGDRQMDVVEFSHWGEVR
jgi:hypothetical protein